jgi:hypothetical protein
MIIKGDDFLMDADPAYFKKIFLFYVEGCSFGEVCILP